MTHVTAKRFSQNDEQDHILGHFLHNFHGRFLDIGAYDGVTFSNTRALLERGWSGVYVEPSPTVLPALQRASQGWPVSIVAKAIGSTPGPVPWFDCADGVATTSQNHMRKWQGQVAYTEASVEMWTPATLLEHVGDDFDFVSIDVEGNNESVVLAMPWERLKRCTLVCVEHDRAFRTIKSTLALHGFTRELTWNPENLLLAR